MEFKHQLEQKANFKICQKIKFGSRELSKGIAMDKLISRGFFTSGNGSFNHLDTKFPYAVQFSHWSHLNEVRINYNINKLECILKLRYREKLWRDKLIDKIDELLKTSY